MLGKLFQLLDSEGDQLGLLYYSGDKHSQLDLTLQWQKFQANCEPDDSDDIESFVEFINKDLGDHFERVFVDEVYV
jgi:hypothetical protein